ncbi:MAG: hypothetical protein R3E44_09820 [Paracoccaceae bacterium]
MHFRLRLILVSLRHLSVYGLSKAGADMFGSTERRYRVAAHLAVRDMAAEALRVRE